MCDDNNTNVLTKLFWRFAFCSSVVSKEFISFQLVQMLTSTRMHLGIRQMYGLHSEQV